MSAGVLRDIITQTIRHLEHPAFDPKRFLQGALALDRKGQPAKVYDDSTWARSGDGWLLYFGLEVMSGTRTKGVHVSNDLLTAVGKLHLTREPTISLVSVADLTGLPGFVKALRDILQALENQYGHCWDRKVAL